jgi:hypothetical protein
MACSYQGFEGSGPLIAAAAGVAVGVAVGAAVGTVAVAGN